MVISPPVPSINDEQMAEMAQMRADGASQNQIAAHFRVSSPTVRKYLAIFDERQRATQPLSPQETDGEEQPSLESEMERETETADPSVSFQDLLNISVTFQEGATRTIKLEGGELSLRFTGNPFALPYEQWNLVQALLKQMYKFENPSLTI